MGWIFASGAHVGDRPGRQGGLRIVGLIRKVLRLQDA